VNNKRRSHGLGELQKRERFVQRGGPPPHVLRISGKQRGYGDMACIKGKQVRERWRVASVEWRG
jgi:hypothetical protein